MLPYLKDYLGDYEDCLNVELMTKDAETELVDYIVDSWKSLEVVKYIKFLGYEYNTKESSIDINKHIFKRNKGVPKKLQYNYKMINDDRCGLLTVHLKITINEKDPKTGMDRVREKIINKDMLIPLVDEDGYLYIGGKKYYLIYQLLEKSTYTTLTSCVVKSLMPVTIKRVPVTHIDVDGTGYLMPVFRTFVFHRETDIMLFIASQFGIEYGLIYLKVNNVMRLIPSIDNRTPDNIYFQVSSKCYLEVNRDMFEKWQYVQAIAAGLLEILTNRFDLSMIDNRDQFIKKLTPSNTVEKGLDTLTSFNRMLDETTKKVLKIHDYHKNDVYGIIRWAMMEFNYLRMKDNMNLDNKRLRCFECCSSLLTQDFSSRLNRIINLGTKVTLENIVDIFKFSGNLLIQKMHQSGLLRFNECINDMTFFNRFKWTSKGPHSLGRKNSNNISARYRGVHPSYLSQFDLLSCGNSDPGTSGILSPFSKIKGLYFNEDGEPDNFLCDFARDINKLLKKKSSDVISVEFETKDDFYHVMNFIDTFVENNITVYSVDKDKPSVIFVKEKDMVAEHESGEPQEGSDDIYEGDCED